jgi:Fe2+ transport system protein B
MLTSFMPCGAKLPVIALFAGAFFNDAAWVGTLMYFVGIAIIFVGALVIVRITGEKNARAFFIMELPEYRIPSIKRATISMLSSGKAFIVKAGTIILLSNATVQIMQSFNWKFQMVAEGAESTSILATVASPFAIFVNTTRLWRMAISSSGNYWFYCKRKCRRNLSCSLWNH